MALKITGKLTDPRTPFRSVPSALPLGTALADVSMGWDGTVWGIDERGVPYRLDPLAETWQLLGRGYDALTYDEDGRFLVIRDGLVFEASGTAPPQPLTRRWPNAATSFQHALDGAGRAAGEVFLFGSGRYAVASDDHAANPPRPLASLAGWPSGPDWSIFADGVIDAVGSNEADAEDPHLLLFRRGWYVAADMAKRQVVGGPWPVSDLFESLPTPTPMPPPLEAGFDAVLYLKQNRTDIKSFTGLELYQGLVVWGVGHRGATTAYADFYEGWSPTLAEAPSGRAADLWSTAKDGTPRHHDGSDWSGGPSHDGGALRSISVGADGAVFAVGGDNTLLRLSPDRTAWTRLATVPADAAQVAAGDAGRVWVRGQQGGVLQYGAAGGSLAPVPLGAPATHIAGNHDGTLWHCRADGAAVHRFISESEGIDTGQRSQALPVAPDVSSVISVASLGFGTAYVLATARSKTGLGEGSSQLYAYDSPYVFKTSASYNYGYNIATGGGQVYFQVWEPDSQYIVALDAHTGEERWRTPASEPQRVIYDANYQFVYVATVGQGSTLYALDARTGAPAWTTDADELGLSAMSMSLGGNALCVADVEPSSGSSTRRWRVGTGPAGAIPSPSGRWSCGPATPTRSPGCR
jgi:hypothetical protein